MHHMKLKAAVAKYGSRAAIVEHDELLADGYTEDEITEIMMAIEAANVGNPAAIPNNNKKYEEWRGRNEVKKAPNGEVSVNFKKLEKIKDVWISESTAEALNSGAESPNATNPIMYIPA